jgi:hypothetical protein
MGNVVGYAVAAEEEIVCAEKKKNCQYFKRSKIRY